MDILKVLDAIEMTISIGDFIGGLIGGSLFVFKEKILHALRTMKILPARVSADVLLKNEGEEKNYYGGGRGFISTIIVTFSFSSGRGKGKHKRNVDNAMRVFSDDKELEKFKDWLKAKGFGGLNISKPFYHSYSENISEYHFSGIAYNCDPGARLEERFVEYFKNEVRLKGVEFSPKRLPDNLTGKTVLT